MDEDLRHGYDIAVDGVKGKMTEKDIIGVRALCQRIKELEDESKALREAIQKHCAELCKEDDTMCVEPPYCSLFPYKKPVEEKE